MSMGYVCVEKFAVNSKSARGATKLIRPQCRYSECDGGKYNRA